MARVSFNIKSIHKSEVYTEITKSLDINNKVAYLLGLTELLKYPISKAELRETIDCEKGLKGANSITITVPLQFQDLDKQVNASRKEIFKYGIYMADQYSKMGQLFKVLRERDLV